MAGPLGSGPVTDVKKTSTTEESEVPVWQPKAIAALQQTVASCCRRPKGSLYLEMWNRKYELWRQFGSNQLGRYVREPWCVLTVRFLRPEPLLDRMHDLPTRLAGNLIAWLWVSMEPRNLWDRCPAACTCVLLLAGVPASYSVRRVVDLMRLYDDATPDRPSRQSDDVCDWWMQPLADDVDFDQWYGDHNHLLLNVQRALEVRPGDSITVYSVGQRQSVSTTRTYPSPPYSSSGNECLGGRQPLQDLHVNLAWNRLSGGVYHPRGS